MTKLTDDDLDAKDPLYWLQRCIKAGIGKRSKIWREQEWMLNSLVGGLRNSGYGQLVSGPTGSGKAAIICSAAIWFALQGKRVLILSPNYIHLDTVIRRHLNIKELPPEISIAMIKGYSDLVSHCPKTGSGTETEELKYPGRRTCHKWREECAETECPVVEMFSKASLANIVLSVIHKLVYDPLLFTSENSKDLHAGFFDIILIDECHNLPDVITNYSEDIIPIESLRPAINNIPPKIREELQDYLDLLPNSESDDKKELLREFRDVFREYYRNHPKDLKRHSVYTPLIWPRKKVKSRVTPIGFVIYREDVRIDFHGKISVGMVSATVETSEKFIYEDCHFEGLKVLPSNDRAYSSNAPTFRRRFKRLRIFGCTDTPDLRKDDTYSSKRETANALMKDTLISIFNLSRDYVTLVLCRSKDDADQLYEYMLKSKEFGDILLNIDALEAQIRVETEYDPEEGIDGTEIVDELGKRVDRAIKEGRRIFLVTGSSRFWEGVNIENLRFVIIDALPYRAPSPREISSKRGGMRGHISANPIFHFMIRRLQQGIGRLMRRDVDEKGKPMWGVCLVLDNRFVRQGKFIRKRLPSLLTREGTIIINNLKNNLERMRSDVKRLEEGKQLIADLEDFFSEAG